MKKLSNFGTRSVHPFVLLTLQNYRIWRKLPNKCDIIFKKIASAPLPTYKKT